MQPILSLIIPVRKRLDHARCTFKFLNEHPLIISGHIEYIVVEGDLEPSYASLFPLKLYAFEYLQGVFWKTRLLNIGLSLANGKYVAPYDIDLIPAENTLDTFAGLLEKDTNLLFSGYRLMSDLSVADTYTDLKSSKLSVGNENSVSATLKYLNKKERFGVVPTFKKETLLSIGGWDENYRGWGGEDQDIIDRYLMTDKKLCLLPDLLYYHLHHAEDKNWCEREHRDKNRNIFYSKFSN